MDWVSASGVQSLNTQTRVRIWSLEHGRPEVPVRTQALGSPELRAVLWWPVRLRDCVVVSSEGVGGFRGHGVFLGPDVPAKARGPDCSWAAARDLH